MHIPPLACLLFGLLLLLPRAAAGGLIPVEDYRLDNGLRVILHQDRRFPLVLVHLRYHVGARHERPGRTGLAHLFEHLMFRGSRDLKDPDEYLFSVGASEVNGGTSFDYTDYYALLPRDNLPAALWAESDRMGFLILDGPRLIMERLIVKNERRQRLETVPYGHAEELLWRALFPPPHPYHGFIIGAMADLDAATVDDLRAFHDRHYAPGNATLALVGDIEPGPARALVRRYFATLPARPRAAPPPALPVQPVLKDDDEARPGPTVLVHREEVGTGRRIFLAWPSPPAYRPGDRAAHLLAHVLCGNRQARLQRRLTEAGLALAVQATQQSLGLRSVFRVEVALAEGADEAAALRAVDAVFGEIRERGVTEEEVRRAREHRTTRVLASLQALRSKAELLQRYATYLGAADSLAEDLHAYAQLRPEALRDLAREVLRPERLVLLSAAPGPAAGEAR